MSRVLLYAVLLVFLARALAKLWAGVMEGLDGGSQGRAVPQRGVPMVRDPVCGTFLVRDRAVALSAGGTTHYFCSARCRDAYRANPGAGSAA
jgi:YHS domain-containing protein